MSSFRKWIYNKIQLLKDDKELCKLFLCHLLLVVLHYYEYKTEGIEYFWYLRAGGCALISILIFFIGGNGLAYGLFIFANVLIYVNNFYNYATIFFVHTAIGANPKLKKLGPLIYIANVAISFKLQHLDIIAFCIHVIYTIMFGIKINYVFIPKKIAKLKLAEDERIVLESLASGMLQKEIVQFTENQVTQIIKNAISRNMCKSKAELMQKYLSEFPERKPIESLIEND